MPRLRAIRQSLGLSQSQVEQKTGIPGSTLSKLEHGSQRPSVEQARALFDVYHGHISLAEIHDPMFQAYNGDALGSVCPECGGTGGVADD